MNKGTDVKKEKKKQNKEMKAMKRRTEQFYISSQHRDSTVLTGGVTESLFSGV